jgi:hypothetical protein
MAGMELTGVRNDKTRCCRGKICFNALILCLPTSRDSFPDERRLCSLEYTIYES